MKASSSLRVDVDAALKFIETITPPGSCHNIVAIHPSTKDLCEGVGYQRDNLQPARDFIAQHTDWNLYWGVNSTDSLINKKPSKSDIAAMHWAHLDLDEPTEEALQRIRTAMPPPTLIIFSGGGYGAFWKLDKPVRVNGNLGELETVNKRLIKVFDAGKGTWNLDRLMRLPSTVNHLSAKKRRDGRKPAATYLVEHRPERVYGLEQLATITCAAPRAASKKEGVAPPTNKDRSALLLLKVAEKVRAGWTDQRIHAEFDTTDPHVLDQSDPVRAVQRCIDKARKENSSDEHDEPPFDYRNHLQKVQSLLDNPPPKIEFLHEGILARGASSLLVGRPKNFKSTLAAQFALAQCGNPELVKDWAGFSRIGGKHRVARPLMPELFRRLVADIERSRDALVPAAYQCLWQITRFLVLYGGRSAAKSWSIARVLLVLAHEQPLRVLCCREIQGSIRESAYRLLADQIGILQLDDFFDIQADTIIGRNGSRFYFEGLKYNASKIRSYEGVDIVWVEEAQSVSEMSWETLLPTIRKPGSRFFISFNPMTRDDPVARRFVDNPPPNCIAKKVSYRDNPHLSPEADAERAWLERTDPDAYRHVWEGEPRTVSDALILKGKYAIETFEVSPAWAGPYHGLDYGFARDPSAAVRCHIDDATRTLYVGAEFWQLGADIDALPGLLEAAIPGISRHVVYADNARPESTSYLQRNGISNARSAEKWPGSVDDGIAYLRSFARIVIDPACKHLIDECGSYSFKTDRLTGTPLPEPEDRNNHLIDALRYALSPLIRNQPTGGYFSRSALLVRGEPVEAAYPARILMTLAMCERPGTAVGVIFWAYSPNDRTCLRVLDYDLAEIEEAFDSAWLERIYQRAQELRAESKAIEAVTALLLEEGEMHDALCVNAGELIVRQPFPPLYDLLPIKSDQLPPTLDDRATRMRATINSGQYVKLARSAYTRQVTHRGTTSNRLVSQVLGYRPGANDQAAELVNAFLLGCLICFDERRRG